MYSFFIKDHVSGTKNKIDGDSHTCGQVLLLSALYNENCFFVKLKCRAHFACCFFHGTDFIYVHVMEIELCVVFECKVVLE